MSTAPVDLEQRSRSGLAAVASLVLLITAVALWLYPVDADAAFVMHDPLWYGMNAERAPRASLNPHHLGFHVLVAVLVDPLERIGVARPGHAACRVVAGLGAVILVVQICALAGRRRLLAGAVVALAFVATRGFLVETATGENVMPAAAAALAALVAACREKPNTAWTTAALSAALILRQDNLLVVPAVAAAVALHSPRGTRLRNVVVVLGASAAATLATYAACWWIAGRAAPFGAWLLGIGALGPASGPKSFDPAQLAVWAGSIATVVTGRITPAGHIPIREGIGYVAVFLLAGLLLRGDRPRSSFALPVVMTCAARALFHGWFEADNFEWLILPLALVAALAAATTRGAPATGPGLRAAGAGVLVALAIWALAAHGRWTWRLRERTFIDAIAQVAATDRATHRFVAVGVRADQALALLEVPHATIDAGPDAIAAVGRELGPDPGRTSIVWDRGLFDGMPHALRHAGAIENPLDAMPLGPGWERLVAGRATFGVRLTPAAASSRAR